jgi:hypothetical protein
MNFFISWRNGREFIRLWFIKRWKCICKNFTVYASRLTYLHKQILKCTCKSVDARSEKTDFDYDLLTITDACAWFFIFFTTSRLLKNYWYRQTNTKSIKLPSYFVVIIFQYSQWDFIFEIIKKKYELGSYSWNF